MRDRNTKLGQRLIGSFMLMAFCVAVTGIYGTWSLKRVGTRIQDTLKSLALQQKQVLHMEVTQKICHVNLLQVAAAPPTSEKFVEYNEDFQVCKDLFRAQAETLLKGNVKLGLKPLQQGSDMEIRTRKALESWSKFEEIAEGFLAGKKNTVQGTKAVLAGSQVSLATLTALAGIMEANEKAKTDLDDLLVTVNNQMTQANKELSEIQRDGSIAFVSVFVCAIILAAILGVMTTRNIIRRINRMVNALDRGAEGDLTVQIAIDSNDELDKVSRDFNSMLAKLCAMIGNVGKSTLELQTISHDISDVSANVVNAAKIQADGVNETSSAMTEINASIKGITDSVEGLSLSAVESSSSILEMVASIEEVALNVETLSQSVEEVSSSIGQMAVTIKEVGNGVISLMEASATTASSVMEMDSSIKQVERNATEAVAISDEVRLDAEEGKKAVEATIAGINEIRHASSITSEVIVTLSIKAEDIGAILSVIDEVAEQTNLLALNAAIIAAQAGEHGKGFAVVADEIKELAERTSNSTREIAQVIKGVQDETRRAVDAINIASKSIAEGESLSQRSGEALNKIVLGVNNSTNQMEEIARATEEQSRGSQMIRDAMEQVSEMVAQIAKATREQGSGSELIITAVERMKGLTTQVRASTREQSKVGNFISNSTEHITGMIDQIKRACSEQNRGSESIVHAIENIQQSTRINIEAVGVMEDAIKSLATQIESIQMEMAHFKVKS